MHVTLSQLSLLKIKTTASLVDKVTAPKNQSFSILQENRRAVWDRVTLAL